MTTNDMYEPEECDFNPFGCAVMTVFAVVLIAIIAAIVTRTVWATDALDTPTLTPTPTLVAAANPRCTKVMTVDGPMGFLWKAVSDVGGKLTVIFPTEFRKPFKTVTVRRIWNYRGGRLVYRKKPVLDKCVVGDFGNGDRLHARCPYPGAYYDGRVVADDGEQVCEWQVSCPGVRQD